MPRRRAKMFRTFRQLVRHQRRQAVAGRRQQIQQHPSSEPSSVLQAELRRLQHDLQAFYADAITQAYGANDCDHIFRQKGRGVFCELCKRGLEIYDGDGT